MARRLDPFDPIIQERVLKRIQSMSPDEILEDLLTIGPEDFDDHGMPIERAPAAPSTENGHSPRRASRTRRSAAKKTESGKA